MGIADRIANAAVAFAGNAAQPVLAGGDSVRSGGVTRPSEPKAWAGQATPSSSLAVPVLITPIADQPSARALLKDLEALPLVQRVELQEFSVTSAKYVIHTSDQVGMINSLVRSPRLRPIRSRFLAGSLVLTLAVPLELPIGPAPLAPRPAAPRQAAPEPAAQFGTRPPSPQLRLIRMPEQTHEQLSSPAPDPAPATGSIKLQVDAFFNARHFVVMNGRQGPAHAHSWRVQSEIRAAFNDRDGVALPFATARRLLQTLVGGYNDTLLNEVAPFDRIQPTAENIAATIYRSMARSMDLLPVQLLSISVWESPTNCVTYSEAD